MCTCHHSTNTLCFCISLPLKQDLFVICHNFNWHHYLILIKKSGCFQVGVRKGIVGGVWCPRWSFVVLCGQGWSQPEWSCWTVENSEWVLRLWWKGLGDREQRLRCLRTWKRLSRSGVGLGVPLCLHQGSQGTTTLSRKSGSCGIRWCSPKWPRPWCPSIVSTARLPDLEDQQWPGTQ